MFQSELDDWRFIVKATLVHMQETDVGLYQVCTEAGLKFDALTTSLFSRRVLTDLGSYSEPPEWVINTCQRMTSGDAEPSSPLVLLTRKMATYLVEKHPEEN